MRKNQKGFGLVEIMLTLAVISLLGAAGWYVWKQNSSASNTSIGGNSPNPNTNSSSNENKIEKAGWKSLADMGIQVKYPESWDITDEDFQRLKIDGKVDGEILFVGFGSPFGYKYLGNNSWVHVDMDGNKIDDDQPNNPPENAKVKDAESTILVGSGDGGCGGYKLGFVHHGTIYAISLPWTCDKDTFGSEGIAADVIEKDLAEVIRSVRMVHD